MPTSPCLLAKVPDYKKGLAAATGLLGPYGQAVAGARGPNLDRFWALPLFSPTRTCKGVLQSPESFRQDIEATRLQETPIDRCWALPLFSPTRTCKEVML